ncbi:MAG: hypothetical protein QM796_18395 [Chthoniobacteraceae bacterium]
MKIALTGKMSTFGGPEDTGVGPHEGLALRESSDLNVPWYCIDPNGDPLFLSKQPDGTTGLARRLNPNAFYCALRIDQVLGRKLSEALPFIRRHVVDFINPSAGTRVKAMVVDYGPADGTVIDGQPTRQTGRLADLSPGLAAALGLKTDDTVNLEIYV